MNIIMIALALIAVLVYGYWLMSRLDNFFASDRFGEYEDRVRTAAPKRTVIASLMCKMHHF